MNDTELCYLPATEALRLFRTHKLSPVELLEAQIKRADQVEPIINAFTDTFYDDALKKAKAAEKRYKDAARSYLDHLFGRMLARAYEESPDLLCDYTKYYAQRAGTCGQEKFLWTYESVAACMKPWVLF